MAHHKIEYDCQCASCEGTGLYKGFAENGGAAVVDQNCQGTGKRHVVIEYDDFEGKKRHRDITRVIEVNPGIGVGVRLETGLTLESFGGMPYEDWFSGKPFPPKSEMRKFTCPVWWYQSADYEKKPDWDWCNTNRFGRFYSCLHFATKEKCWERFDAEHPTT
jgi:hypothetical protein